MTVGKRILVAVVMIPVLLAVIFLLPDWVLAIGVTGLSMIAIHEVLWSTGFVKDPKISGLSIALAGLIPEYCPITPAQLIPLFSWDRIPREDLTAPAL